MSARNKSLFLLVILLFALGMTACTRGRLRQDGTDSPATVSAPTQSPASLPDPEPVQPAQASAPAVAPTAPPDLSQDLQELEALLGELDQILGSADTDVNIP